MACDGYAVLANRFKAFHLLLVIQLTFLLLGSSLVAAQSDSSYYDYDVASRNSSRERPSYSSLVGRNEFESSERQRRYGGKEPAVDEAKATPEPPVIETETSSANVKYSTGKLTTLLDDPSTGGAPPTPVGKSETAETTARTPNIETPESPKNPADGQPIHVFSDLSNETLAQNHITKVEEDTRRYYNSTFFLDENVAKMYWVDMDNHPDRRVNHLFNKSHRRAATVKLKFDFPFYGHKVRNVTIATGGFLYTGDYVHSWLAPAQYIAPLMANFDTRISNDSSVKYADNGTALTVEWERVVLQDRPEAGGFTFQATLYDDGNIVFVYSKIPLTIGAIEDTAHPVKVGLSDAYIMDRNDFFFRRKTIYEYRRVNFNRQEIRNWSVIYLRALPTCLEMKNCNDCLTKVPEFDCKWCPDLHRCSTGTFRGSQDSLEKGCETRNIGDKDPATPATAYNTDHSDSRDNAGGRLSSDEVTLPRLDSNDLSYYDYDVPSRNSSRERPSYSSLVGRNEFESSERQRRYAGKEPAVDEAKATAEPPVIKTETSSANVTYSTDKLTTLIDDASTGGPPPTPVGKNEAAETPASTPNIETSKALKNTSIIVSNPMNPANGQPIHVWANQTQWEKPDQRSATKVETDVANATVAQSATSTTTTTTTTTTAAAAAAAAAAAGTDPTNKQGSTASKAGQIDEKGKEEVTTGKKNAASLQSSNSTDGELGDIAITKFSDVTNNTLAQNNITKTEEDTHQYYNSTFFSDENVAKMYWVDMDNHPDRQVNDLLSKSHRRAATVKLKFDFPFYGHKVRNITIATGGFLYTGEYVHSWLAATQYIAPLMANFDTRISNDSWVKYADNGTAFTVEWERVVLQDRPEAGGFTFQATLYDNGNIVFVYSKIPLTVEAIEDTAHPVKVGLSDAYIMDRTIFFVRRKTIYEYHRVNFNRQEIRNWTVIYLRALPTCLEMENCNDCLTKVPEFDCKWCPDLHRCSTGTFRHRQDWLEKGCEQRNIKDKDSCPATPTAYTDHSDSRDNAGGRLSSDEVILPTRLDSNSNQPTDPTLLEHTASHMKNMGVSGIIGILLVVSLITGLVAWAGYAYRNPHSASGQMLIRYRPSQWSWRRGEARYTAATIHM